MPPKRTPKKKKVSDDEDDFVVSDEEDVEYSFEPAKKGKAAASKAKPKKEAPAKAPAQKRKPKDPDAEEADEPEEGAKPKKAKTQKLTEVTDLGDNWTFYPPSLLAKDNKDSPKSTKIAAFDFDGTLVNTKSGATFALSADDWKLYNATVPGKLKEYHDKGYKVVIFSNQGGIKSAIMGAASEKTRSRMNQFLAKVDAPVLVFAATMQDNFRKPGTGMWEHMCQHHMDGQQPDLSESFFCGDSIDGGDEGFAAALGITYRSMKQEFGEAAEDEEAAQCANPELVGVFNKLAEQFKGDVWKTRAYKNVAKALTGFEEKISNQPAVLKKVQALPGVGKGSMTLIKEYLSTGTVALLDGLPEDKVAKQGLESKDREQALAFM